ncbi:IS66 family insertion sequence element accessory protein TnpB [Enterobacter ludwigii]|jgi:transposase|uniref:IS66 family insertion sequence element accessory protein TnpB n=1 Tax=Enterobacter ludwigii TaxID=299767 RepID=UPI0013D3F30F|nr:IS66 family insertion sequence element accessory protein TnpB [Enterobacter ludwigii]
MLTYKNVFLDVQPVDMRRGIGALMKHFQDELKSSSHEGAAFIFTDKAHSRIKVLRWDKHGVWLCVRRLHKGHFLWPRASDKAWSHTQDKFSWLITSIDW